MRDLDAQTLGSLIVIAAFASAEIASQMLAIYPGSAWLWYLNLEIFSNFEHARVANSPLHHLFGPASLACWGAVFCATLLARLKKFRFGVSAIANICFACVVGLALPSSQGKFASNDLGIKTVILPESASQVLLSVIFIVSFSAFIASHICFIRQVANTSSDTNRL